MSRVWPDVLIVGAGPAGSMAALLLARAGVRVRLVDRARFPRPKLCGDSLNPGALGILRRLGVAAAIEARGLVVDGMLVTGERVAVDARYAAGVHGLSVRRDVLDQALVDAAVGAGAAFESGVVVTEPIVDTALRSPRVRGVRVRRADGRLADLPAAVTIAADGRRSTLAFALGLASHPAAPRRWAVGAYMSGFTGTASRGEMHIRTGHYIGVAPVAGGLTNVCVVKPSFPGDQALRDPERFLRETIARDPMLRERSASAACVERPSVLGPLAVEPVQGQTAPEGLLLAGDAAGFVDPMTGDGMRFALRGAELAAAAALRALEHGWDGVRETLAGERQREFSAKWRVNRALRGLVGMPLGVRGAAVGARVAPQVVRALVRYASDCRFAVPA